MRTTDGGATWDAVYSPQSLAQNGRAVALTSRPTMEIISIHLTPSAGSSLTRNRAFSQRRQRRLVGQSSEGVPRSGTRPTYRVEFDPKVRGRMWGVNSYTHDLPRPKMWRQFVLHYKGGVCRSDDGGRTGPNPILGWPRRCDSYPARSPQPRGARVLYVAVSARGLQEFRWRQHVGAEEYGNHARTTLCVAVGAPPNGTLYVVVARRTENGSIGNDGDGALYRSTDGAEHWAPVPLPEGTNGPNGLAVDPESPDRLYLAAWARATGEHGDGGGIFLSENGGESGSRCSTRIATFMTSLLIRKSPMLSTRLASNHRLGDRQTAGCIGHAFPDLTSSGDTE